jgi:hypothetical protein
MASGSMESPEDGNASSVQSEERLRCYACQQVHPNAKLVKTEDGRQLGLQSEEYRRYCEAKHVLNKYRSKLTRQKYLADIQTTRNQAAAVALREEMLRIWTYRKEKASASQQRQISNSCHTQISASS